MAKTNQDRLQRLLANTEKALEKVRGASVLDDGWQTMRYAKKARKWDMLAPRKMQIIRELEACADAEAMCGKCDCWKRTRATCS